MRTADSSPQHRSRCDRLVQSGRDGFLGSSEFVDGLRAQDIGEAHIFEMVGYCDPTLGSQKAPSGIPSFLVPKIGDFLGLLANSGSNAIAERLIDLAAGYTPGFPVLALKIELGLERLIGDLNRSDHGPFWRAGIPAIMWTDTAEFRNPNYHRASDTPDTLDYGFMAMVAKLALARAIAQA